MKYVIHTLLGINDTISFQDSVYFYDYAQRCPIDEGYIVYACRAILANYFNEQLLDTSIVCGIGLRESNSRIDYYGSNDLVIINNPVNEDLIFKVTSDSVKEKSEYIITNILGNPLRDGKFYPNKNQEKINISNFSSGIYILSVIFGDGSIKSKSFIKY